MHAALARGAGLLVLELLQEGFLFERALVELGEGVARAQDEVDPVAGKEEDEHQEHGDHLHDGVAAALADVAVGPEDERQPDRREVDGEHGDRVLHGGFP